MTSRLAQMRRLTIVPLVAALSLVSANSGDGATAAQNRRFVLACGGCPLNQSGSSLYTVRADGTDLRRLPGICCADPAWSPAGTRLAYTRNEAELWVAGAEGRRRRRLFGDVRRATAAASPTWSPEGDRIAFINRSAIWVVDTRSARARLLVRPPRTLGSVSSVAWSPDGEQLAFGTTREQLYLVRSDGRGARRLGSAATRGRAPRWSPDSRRLTFLRLTDRWSLGVINRDGSGVATLADHSEIDWNANPAWSPDGRYIAFTISHEYGDDDTITGQIMIASLSDGRVRRVKIPSIPPEGAWAHFTGIDWQPSPKRRRSS
jgi:Tol biopolymer transport system component